MKMKDLLKKSWIEYAGLASVIGLFISAVAEYGTNKAIGIVTISFAAICVLMLILHILKSGKVSAFWEQKKVGCFQGLWKSANLSGELKRNFENAQTIKIKVTRGSELFDKKQNGNISNYLEYLRDVASSEREILCRFLLIAPCYRLRHVRERHILSKKKYQKPEDFLGSWYDTIKAIDDIEKEKNNVHFQVEVRFYSGRHSKWRFYIFESLDRAIKTVLFSDYDADRRTHGTELPMYKVIKNDQNIGGFMERYFDEIWNVALTKEGFKELINNGTCVRRFCEDCDIESVNKQGCQLCTCPLEKCAYEENCKKLVNDRL